MEITIQTVANAFHMKSTDPNANYSAETALSLGVNASTYAFHGAAIFDFSSLPAIATIYRVKLWLYVSASHGSIQTYPIYIRRCLRDLILSEFTWNNYKTGSAWTTAGGLGANTDYTATYAATLYAPASGSQWMSVDITPMINYIRANLSSIAKLLFHAYPGPSAGDYVDCYSSAYTTDPTKRPKLVIEYSYPKNSNNIRIF